MAQEHGDFDISKSTVSSMEDNVDNILVDTITPDAATGDKETTWINTKFSQYLGYYKSIPEVKTAIDMRAIWTVGKGYKADTRTMIRLEHIKGFGIDTFDTILKNMIVIRRVGGDAFAEIIRDPVTQQIINLKPLDPAVIKIVANKKGVIIRYEQVEKSSKKTLHKFKPKEIFHLTNKRVADEIHGVSDIEAIEAIIKASNESFEDMKKLQHRFVKPIMAFKLDTDNQTEINAFITKMDETINKGENIYIPKGTVEFELVSVPSNATLNPLPWRNHLRDYFFQVVGIPQIILGSSGEFTESTAKIAYLAFQQSVEDEQKDIEEQVWNQMYFKIELEFPASLQNEMISDEGKDEQTVRKQAEEPPTPQPQPAVATQQQTGFQPNDTIAGVGA